LILLVCFIVFTSIAIACIGHYVLLQGAMDEVAFPLGNCDTSIYEELMVDDKKA
jgi:hypothetical protein